MPKPDRTRGYRHSVIFNTFMQMFHEGDRCIDDVRHLRGESALMKLLSFWAIPCATTLCMLAYYVEFEMRKKLAPLLFDDEAEYPLTVTDAGQSAAACRKAKTKRNATAMAFR